MALTKVNLANTVEGILPVANGGTGSSSGQVYPASGIANSTGTAWGTSYTTTGSGTVLALATSPSFTTPILGTPTSGNFSTGTFTWPTFNQNTSGSAGSVANALTISSPLTGTSYNGSGAVSIGIPAATTSVSGYLTSTDWNTFNGKQPAGSYLTTAVTSAVAGTGISVSGATGAVTFTNSGVTSIVAGTGISISGGTGAVTITNSSTGGVTSAVAGNGVAVSGATGAVTFSASAPSFNSVGSYCFVKFGGNGTNGYPTGGTNYAAGVSQNQIAQASLFDGGGGMGGYVSGLSLSGTWKWMGQTNVNNISQDSYAIACRVA